MMESYQRSWHSEAENDAGGGHRLRPRLLAVQRLSFIGPARLAGLPNFRLALGFNDHVFLLHIAADRLGVVNLALANDHFFLHHRFLGHPNLLFLDGDANFLGLEIPRRGPAGGRSALDHDFLTLNRHVDLLVLGVHFLADLHLASIHWLLVGSQMFFPDLDSST